MGLLGQDAPDETVEASGSAGKSRELVAGVSLGKYRLDHVLGTGGMGVVWAAHDPDLERAVALKVLRYENAALELRRRLLREARAMARLKHANVLTVYEVDSDGDRDFIAMELVEGSNLDRWLATRPSPDEIWQAILAAGRGLAAAHAAGLVHRDFKPHNVLRSHDGRVLVTDFGLARGHDDPAAVALETTLPVGSGLEATISGTPSTGRGALDALTQTGAIVGTPAYMAPEQFLGAACDPRTDQFAYCVTAWQLLTGERPFRGTTIEELRAAASTGVPQVRGKLPGALRAVFARGLSPDPAKRWPDMKALLAALERAKAGPRRRLRIGLGVAVAAVGVGLVVKLARNPAASAYSKVANQLARRSHHYHLEADTWMGLMSGEIDAATDPSDAGQFLDLIAQARVATRNAGDDPTYLARIAQTEGGFARSRGRLDEAIEKHKQALAIELSAGSAIAVMRCSVDAAEAMLMRNRPGDLAAAWDMLVDAERVVASAKLWEEKWRRLASEMSLVAQLRGDLATAHAWADRDGRPKPPAGSAAITGRVVDADGRGVAGATVVAWRGRLEGDATRAYKDANFEGDIATTGADGAFTVQGVRDGAIIAELGDRRSRPRAIGPAALTLTLEATREFGGSVASDDEVLTGIAILAHFRLGPEVAWDCAAPVGRLHDYRLAGVPSGDATFRLDARLDPNRPFRKLDFGPIRTGAELRWPVGPSIDAIVRGAPDRMSTIYVLRGRRTAKTRADLDRLRDSAAEVVVHPALVVGIGDQTPEGMKHYARGDRHAVLVENAPGEVTVCVAEDEPISPAACQTIEIPKTAVETRDGRGVYPTIPVVFQR